MNAIRQYITTTDGKITLQLPKEYFRRKLEIIILPADEITDDLGEVMDKMSETARKNGLTEELLADEIEKGMKTPTVSGNDVMKALKTT